MPDVISDEEDSEADTAIVGCLGFLPLSGQETPVRTLPPESERTPSKTDIAAASPGAVATDPESQSEFRKERAVAEQRREREKLDIHHMQKQYMRMRKLQRKNMLVFNSFANQTTRPKNEVRSKAINHLFIDLPSFDRDKKSQRHVRYPFLKPAANGSSRIPNARQTNDRIYNASEEIEGTIKNSINGRETRKTTIQNTENEYPNAELLGYDSVKDVSVSHEKTQKDARKGTQRAVTDLSSTTFIVDKNAMYPTNFKPFPQRTQTPKSKLFISNQLGGSSNKVKLNKNSNNLSNAPVR